MPRLPTVEQLGQTPTPSVRGGVSPLHLETPNLGHEAAALADFGQAMQGLGDTIGKLAQKEKLQTDELRSIEAKTNYQNELIRLQTGDPQNNIEGFSQVLNGDAVKRPLVEEYRQKRNDLREKIREGLGNDQQKIMFDKQASVEDQQFDGRLYQHIATQSASYRKITFEGAKETAKNNAALNWDKPGAIDMAVLQSNVNVEHEARMEGLDPARPADRDTIDRLKQAGETEIHAAVIDTMLMQGKDAAASSYFAAIQEKLTPEARVILGTKVRASSTEGEAERIATDIWNKHGPQDMNSATNLELMDNEARAASDDPKVRDSIIQRLHQRAQTHDYTQNEVNSQNKATVLDEFNKGKSLADLQKLPAWQAMNGAEREQLTEYVQNRGYTAKSRAEHDFEYEQGLKSRAGFQTFWELSNPAKLAGMSEAQILALEPTLGQRLVGNLMEIKRRISTSEGKIAVTVDTDLFNSSVAGLRIKGLNPYDAKLSPDSKEKLGRLRNQVESVIDIAQRNAKRELNREEKKAIIDSELSRTVQTPTWGFGLFGGNKLPAAVVAPDQRSKYVVPFGDIPPAWSKGMANLLRSEGKVPLKWTDQQIYRNKQKFFERAYAVSSTGGSKDEAMKEFQ